MLILGSFNNSIKTDFQSIKQKSSNSFKISNLAKSIFAKIGASFEKPKKETTFEKASNITQTIVFKSVKKSQDPVNIKSALDMHKKTAPGWLQVQAEGVSNDPEALVAMVKAYIEANKL